jgi:Xaa-Pro aminopeptidase
VEKVKKIKNLLKKMGLDGFIIPKNDQFFGEYVSKNNDKLKSVSNFTGSYGLALILKKKNYLFVDGRYTLQAKKECGKIFNIVTIPKILPKNILKKKKLFIGFDPKIHTELNIKTFFQDTNCSLISLNEDLIESIWPKKKNFRPKKYFLLKKNLTGQSSKNKINTLVELLKKNKADLQFISAPENVAWIVNIRGYDSPFSPLPNCYLVLDNKKKLFLFCDLKNLDKKTKQGLKNFNIIDISLINLFFRKLKNKKIQVDKNSCSIYFKNILKKNNYIIETQDPAYFLKSIKNKIEIDNTIRSHIYDGAALTKFIFWINDNFMIKKITELSAQEKLLKFRKKNKKFRFPSFSTISASGPNGAIVHYNASLKTNRTLKKGDIYLIDSGGQYNCGTTDVTRTISLNNKDKRIKNIYTRVLKGHIAVASFNLNYNTDGSKIDFEARKFLKQINLDYAHGTGHGVGYFLNVHEGPQAISKNNKVKFKEGMIISNEPGYYEKGKFGIRIENLITVKKIKNSLKFFDLTMAPIDKSLINKSLLSQKEIVWLNSYHDKVFKNLKRFMDKTELLSLKEYCSHI